MIRKEFHTETRIPFRLSDYDNCLIWLEAGGIMDIMTDNEDEAERMVKTALTEIYDRLPSYESKTALAELPDVAASLEQEVSEKLKQQSGKDCAVVFDYLLPDEHSQKLLDNMDKMKKFSDPAYAAAELERAMKQARETAEKNGTIPAGLSQEEFEKIIKSDCVPPLGKGSPSLIGIGNDIPDGVTDPLARAQAITAQVKAMEKSAMGVPIAAPAPEPAQSAPRPKFCGICGSKLPETGKFCPNCGSKI